MRTAVSINRDTEALEMSVETLKFIELTKEVGLGERVRAVMQAVAYLQKKGRNEAQGYRFLGEAQVKGALNKALADHGLYIRGVFHRLIGAHVDETKDGKPRAFAQVETTVQIGSTSDADLSNFVVSTGLGFGADKGGSADKAVYKAQAGALKYALTSLFLIETGDDPEKDEDAPEAAHSPPTTSQNTEVELVRRIAQASSTDELKAIKPDVIYLQASDKDEYERVVAVYRARNKELTK